MRKGDDFNRHLRCSSGGIGGQVKIWQVKTKARADFVTQAAASVIDYIENLQNDPINRGHAWEEQIHHPIATVGISGMVRKLGGDPDRQETGFHIKRLASKRFVTFMGRWKGRKRFPLCTQSIFRPSQRALPWAVDLIPFSLPLHLPFLWLIAFSHP
jgi:hypothetical protein